MKSKNKFDTEPVSGFVVLANLEGEIEEILYNSLTIPRLETGKLIPGLVEENSFKKAIKFIIELRENRALFGWELNVSIEGEVVPLNFSGVTADNKLLILAGNKLENILDYYEQIVEINNNQINNFRKLIKDKLKSPQAKQQITEDNKTYERLSRLNNEFANLQRELARKNKELEAQREKFRVTLESIADGVITTDKEGIINFVNPVAVKLLNQTKDKILGSGYSDVFKVVDSITGNPLKLEFEKRLAEEETVKETEALLIIGDNSTLPIGYKASPIKNKGGQFTGIVLVFRDISQQKKNQQKLEEYASRDMLTGVFNRRMGLKYLNRQIEYVDETSSSLSICFIDVNDLKKVNDNFGHQVGDKLLKEVSMVLQQTIRRSDVVARMGGDEFLLIFPETNQEEAELIWERITYKFKQINQQQEKPYEIKVSHGIVDCIKGCELSAEELIRRADEKMYREKQAIKQNEEEE